MSNKKAQITLVIIIAVVLVLALAITLYITSNDSETQVQQTQFSGDVNLQLQNYIQSCLLDTGLKAVYRVGKHGGYIAPKGDDRYKEEGMSDWKLYFYSQSSFPYGLNKDQISLISKREIKEKINNYILYELNECIKSEDFEKQNFRVQRPQNPIISTLIGTNEVTITADYPLKLVRAGQTVTASKAVAIIPIRLGHIYDVVYKLIRNIKDNQPYDISLNCLKYGNDMVNIYLIQGKTLKLHAIRVIDAQPLSLKNQPPFEFRIGVQNADVVGECVG